VKIEIVIVDDHQIVRDGLVRLLTLDGRYKVVACLSTAEELLTFLRQSCADIIIMDLSMPGMGGVEALRRVLLKWPELLLIIFSIYQNPRLAKHVLKLGAKAYITKSSDSHVLVEGIETIAAGGEFTSPDLRLGPEESGEDLLASLSAKEFDIFCCVSEGLSTQQISEKLFLSTKTIANNISIIKKKLRVNSGNQMMHLAIKEGLLLLDC